MLTKERPREKTPSDGVPVPVADVASARVLQRGKRPRLVIRRLWLPVALAAVLPACGAGSQQPSQQVTGAWVVQTQDGPLMVIAVKKGGAQ